MSICIRCCRKKSRFVVIGKKKRVRGTRTALHFEAGEPELHRHDHKVVCEMDPSTWQPTQWIRSSTKAMPCGHGSLEKHPCWQKTSSVSLKGLWTLQHGITCKNITWIIMAHCPRCMYCHQLPSMTVILLHKQCHHNHRVSCWIPSSLALLPQQTYHPHCKCMQGPVLLCGCCLIGTIPWQVMTWV